MTFQTLMDSMTLDDFGKLSDADARTLLETLRWPNGPACPHCGSANVTRIHGRAATVRPGLWRCRACRKQFTATVGTIFEDSHIPLHKWFLAIALMCSSKKGVSALQLQRNLGLGSYKTAWFMAHRIRYAMQPNGRPPLYGTVEVDETYIGGKRPGKRGRGAEGKTPVVPLIERHGRMRARVVERVGAKELKGAIRELVHKDARIMTDEWDSYQGIGQEFTGGHQTVKHSAGEYVHDEASVNSAESFFALLKRGVHGIFHHVSKEHLPRYCDEFAFRWNYRHTTDGTRTVAALEATEGKRLLYREVG